MNSPLDELCMLDLQSRKKYIFNKIYLLKDHTVILDYFNKNNLNHTINNNGIFINLTTLDEDTINFIYLFLCNDITSIPDNKSIIHAGEYKNKKKIVINDILITIFPLNEQEIIRYSKKEKLF
jgi:hypothetical protein